jgi:hypothetical protein
MYYVLQLQYHIPTNYLPRDEAGAVQILQQNLPIEAGM